MKKIVLMTMVLSIAFGFMLENAYGQCPSWVTQTMPPGYTCAPVPLSYMGTGFDSQGEWIWNSQYSNELTTWATPGIPGFTLDSWEPRKALNWMPAPIGGPNLHVQYKNSGAGTRAYFQLPERVTEYPEVYRWSQDNQFRAFVVASWMLPDGCIPPYPSSCPPGSDHPCCKPPTKPAFNKKQSSDPVDIIEFADIQSVCWEEGDSCVYPSNTQLFGVQSETLISVSYDYISSNPVRQRYSFWFSGVTNWTTYDYPMVYANFEKDLVPDTGPQTIVVTIDGTQHYLHFVGGDTTEPPLVQTYTKSKKGTVTKEHVLAYEDEFGNLIIKWEEPEDLVFEPYWQVRVFIGDKASTLTPSPIFDSLTFAFLEAPFPSSTAVLPAATWGILKKELSCKKFESTVYISIFYRRVYINTTPGNKNEMLQVRSQSDPLPYQFQPSTCP